MAVNVPSYVSTSVPACEASRVDAHAWVEKVLTVSRLIVSEIALAAALTGATVRNMAPTVATAVTPAAIRLNALRISCVFD